MPQGRTEPADGAGEREFLRPDELQRLLKAARGGRHGVRDVAMMLVMYRHALRVSELIELRMDDIDLRNGRLHVRRKKGSVSTYQLIAGDELRALRAWLRVREKRTDADFGYLFLSERGPFTRQAINYLVGETGRRAGLPFHIHPHMLRHSAGYHLAARNADTSLVRNHMGHKNPSHTMRYRASVIEG